MFMQVFLHAYSRVTTLLTLLLIFASVVAPSVSSRSLLLRPSFACPPCATSPSTLAPFPIPGVLQASRVNGLDVGSSRNTNSPNFLSSKLQKLLVLTGQRFIYRVSELQVVASERLSAFVLKQRQTPDLTRSVHSVAFIHSYLGALRMFHLV